MENVFIILMKFSRRLKEAKKCVKILYLPPTIITSFIIHSVTQRLSRSHYYVSQVISNQQAFVATTRNLHLIINNDDNNASKYVKRERDRNFFLLCDDIQQIHIVSREYK